MSRFGPDPRAFFGSLYLDIPPWDIGGPQPALLALLNDYPPANPILDAGCGSGDLAMALAQSGHQVLGIDFVEAAIDHARAKAEALPSEVGRCLEFQVADALQPSRLQRQFGSVVDSGFFHIFDPDDRDRFVEELGLTLIPGGRYYLLAFAEEFPQPNTPRRVTEDELRTRFSNEKGWRIQELRSAEFLNRIAPVSAICACIERLRSGSA